MITGIVQGGTSGLVSASAGQAITGLTVSVVGTAISSGLDATGRFSLAGVPAGDVQLRFAGSGIDTTVSVTSVQPSQSISLVVAVTVTTVSIETDSRTGGGEDQLEARIESLPPTTAAGTFVAGGRTVKTDTATRFEQEGATRGFGDLAIGMRIHVKGNVSGGTLLASLVQIQNTNTAIPIEINGVIGSYAGTASAFQFRIDGRLIKGDAITEFFGGSTFSMLKDGARVEVKGQQRDGYVYATRIHVNSIGDDNDGGDGQDSSASIQGTLTAKSGSGSTFTLTVGGTTVLTTGATEVKRRGDVQTLEALALGQTLHVVGTRQPDKSILARKIEIVDDAPGGEFEVEGSIGGLSGTCPAISFGVNGFSIRTSALTEFEGSACTALKSGTKVQVKGTRAADGVVTATRVKTK